MVDVDTFLEYTYSGPMIICHALTGVLSGRRYKPQGTCVVIGKRGLKCSIENQSAANLFDKHT
jgi:hypothetical protein